MTVADIRACAECGAVPRIYREEMAAHGEVDAEVFRVECACGMRCGSQATGEDAIRAWNFDIGVGDFEIWRGEHPDPENMCKGEELVVRVCGVGKNFCHGPYSSVLVQELRVDKAGRKMWGNGGKKQTIVALLGEIDALTLGMESHPTCATCPDTGCEHHGCASWYCPRHPDARHGFDLSEEAFACYPPGILPPVDEVTMDRIMDQVVVSLMDKTKADEPGGDGHEKLFLSPDSARTAEGILKEFLGEEL